MISFSVFLRQHFLSCVLDDWARSIGLVDLRSDPRHNLIGDVATVDPTEEGASALFHPLSLIIAQFGQTLPNMAKFKVSCKI